MEQDENCGELAAKIGAAAIEELIKQGKRIKYVEETTNE
jgi:2-methylaconitate cis-trans-isomerase PrpF